MFEAGVERHQHSGHNRACDKDLVDNPHSTLPLNEFETVVRKCVNAVQLSLKGTDGDSISSLMPEGVIRLTEFLPWGGENKPPMKQKAMVKEEKPKNVNFIQNVDRGGQLRKIFGVFDLDGSGVIEANELMCLGQARAKTGQKSRVWTVEKNKAMIASMDKGARDGMVEADEFVSYFMDTLQKVDDGAFMKTMAEFRAAKAKYLENLAADKAAWSAAATKAAAKDAEKEVERVKKAAKPRRSEAKSTNWKVITKSSSAEVINIPQVVEAAPETVSSGITPQPHPHVHVHDEVATVTRSREYTLS